jgi:hypothetical protein
VCGYPIVRILWEDAVTSAEAGWTTKIDAMETATTRPPQMYSVGYVLHNCKEWISITDSVGGDEFGQVTKIPKKMIVDLTFLKEDSNDEIIGSYNL